VTQITDVHVELGTNFIMEGIQEGGCVSKGIALGALT